MSRHVTVHIARLVIDGLDVAPRDLVGLREALAAELASSLATLRSRPAARNPDRLQGPDLSRGVARDGFTGAAARAIGAAVAPFCGGVPDNLAAPASGGRRG